MKLRDPSNFTTKGIIIFFQLSIIYNNLTSCQLFQTKSTNDYTIDDSSWSDKDINRRILPKEQSYLPNVGLYTIGESPFENVNCNKPAKCIEIKNATCFGTQLSYTSTSLDLIPKSISQQNMTETLRLLQGLKYIPKCWAVVRPFICSLFMPKCSNNTVELPSTEKCKKVTSLCRILINNTIWPSFIKCDNETLFPKMCQNDPRESKLNSGTCLKPLVPTDNSLALFEGIEGCGKQCENPLFTTDEHQQIHLFIAWGAGICGGFNLFTIITFLIDWRNANKYPALVIFYINCCFLISCIGWLVQFIPGNREHIVCRKDGTPRISEPSGETLSCVVVFILIYYSLMAATVWFVILTYAWHMSFQALGKIHDKIDKKGAYFHLMAWCLPLVLTVAIIAMGEIDGNSITGICFVGYVNHAVRAWFLLGPIGAGAIVGGYFLSRALITLIYLKISSQKLISEHANAKIRETIVRMGLFSTFTFLTVVVTFYCHIYEFKNSWKWNQSFRDYMICAIAEKYGDESKCKLNSKPSVPNLQLHLLAVFFSGILMSSWVWTGSTVDTWNRFFRRTFNKETEEPIKLKKYKVIAQAFAKRKTFNNAGRLSLSFHNTHEDPVGLNFDLNSVASHDFSTTWAAALPKLVTRRGALVGGNTTSVSSNRRNSVDSEISFSVRRVSVESRRNSLDSQISVQIAELKTTRKVASSSSQGHRGRRGKRRRDFGKSRSTKIGPLFRRGSTTSQESQLNAQILSAMTIGGGVGISKTITNTTTTTTTTTTTPQVPNMERRWATAGLDNTTSNKILTDGKNAGMLLPFLFLNHSNNSDEESSEEKNHLGITDKNRNNQVINDNKNDNDSDSDSSQVDEETKMLEIIEQPTQERSKSKNSNKSLRNQEERKSKYFGQDEAILRHFIQQELNNCTVKYDNDKTGDNHRKAAIGDLASSITSYCPDLTKIIKSDQFNSTTNAREMATQTSLPLEILEMEAVTETIDEIINNRNCSSKGTQISPQLNKNLNRKIDGKNSSGKSSSREGRRSNI